MALTEAPTMAVPLRMDVTGTLRVGATRVILDLVIAAFNEGATPEEIVLRYSTLRLPDVYAVIGYYLTNRNEIDAYLCRREAEAEVLRAEIEAHSDVRGLRERLLARRAASHIDGVQSAAGE